MNRRSFLKFFGVATVALATSTLRAADLVMPIERPPAMLAVPWFQNARNSAHYSAEYLVVLDRIMAGKNPQEFINAFSK